MSNLVDFKLTPSEPESNANDPKAWDHAFPEFWKRYPRKIAKLDAERAWRAIRPKNRNSFQEGWKSIARLLKHFREKEWLETPKDKIPYPATWLRRESFDPEDVRDITGD